MEKLPNLINRLASFVDDPGIDGFLVHGFGDGDAMVTVTHIVNLTYPHQVYWRQGDILYEGGGNTYPARAIAFSQRIELHIEVATATQAANDIAWQTWEMGEVYRLMGDLDQARKCYQEALTAFEKMQELIGLGSYHRGMGDIAMMQANLEQARSEYEQALDFQEKEQRVYRVWGLVIIHARMANVLVPLGDLIKARQHLWASLSMAKSWHNPNIKALPLIGIASLMAASGNAEKAIETAACVASKPTTWNEAKKQAWEIMEKARSALPANQAQMYEKQGEETEIDALLRRYL